MRKSHSLLQHGIDGCGRVVWEPWTFTPSLKETVPIQLKLFVVCQRMESNIYKLLIFQKNENFFIFCKIRLRGNDNKLTIKRKAVPPVTWVTPEETRTKQFSRSWLWSNDWHLLKDWKTGPFGQEVSRSSRIWFAGALTACQGWWTHWNLTSKEINPHWCWMTKVVHLRPRSHFARTPEAEKSLQT